MKNLIVLEYSPSQNAFHMHSMSEMLEKNLRAFLSDQATDYIVVGIFDNEKQCERFCERLADIRDKNQFLSRMTYEDLMKQIN